MSAGEDFGLAAVQSNGLPLPGSFEARMQERRVQREQRTTELRSEVEHNPRFSKGTAYAWECLPVKMMNPERIPNLKRLMIREAAGLVGEIPKLLRGEVL